MNARLISPWKHPKSSQYWFRMVIPPRYRDGVGKSEIKQSLGTEDIGEARRLCAARQSEWRKRFEAIDLEERASNARSGLAAVGRYIDAQAIRLGGMDSAIAYELEGVALAEAAYLDKPSSVELGLREGESHPLLEAIYPDPKIRALRDPICLRRASLSASSAAVISGYDSLDRAADYSFDRIVADAVEEALSLAGLPVDVNAEHHQLAARHLLHRLRDYPLAVKETLRAAFPSIPLTKCEGTDVLP
ncbi:DUF6538 domain-containing protein [Sphingomonas sp. ID0503]|uniref:DUF6538 domain-containing protein n=1 Tax=Sphingomonas sp. ID0503 TaxID=3399691 RepID=UPI003AFB50E8